MGLLLGMGVIVFLYIFFAGCLALWFLVISIKRHKPIRIIIALVIIGCAIVALVYMGYFLCSFWPLPSFD